MVGKKVAEETRREDILRAAYDVAARQGARGADAPRRRGPSGRQSRDRLVPLQTEARARSESVDRVLYATAVLRVPDDVAQITRPSERMHALLRAEMDRLSTDPRHFRLLARLLDDRRAQRHDPAEDSRRARAVPCWVQRSFATR